MINRPLLITLVAYVATRLLTLATLSLEQPLLLDIVTWVGRIEEYGLARAFPEYPWLAVWLLNLPTRFGAVTLFDYFLCVLAVILLADALFTWLLWRSGGRGFSTGLVFWLLAFPALGPILLTRFDLLPGVLMGAALIALQAGRWASAGACAALGTGIKLWPAFAVPALLAPGGATQRTRLLAGLFGAGLLLAIVTVLGAGLARIWSPLTTQLGRGLQFEAFAALPVLWLRYFDPAGWQMVHTPACNCHELVGPGVGLAVHAGTLIAAAGVGLLVWLHLRIYAAPAEVRTAARAGLLATLTVLIVIVTSRVFSPQYVIWITAMVAALGALPGGLLDRRDAQLMFAVCLLTHISYPFGFFALVRPGHPGQLGALLALTMRDGMLLAIGARFAIRLWRDTQPLRAAPAPA